ncbi:MAG: diadenylate cyclase CdaA [Clostridiales Family XIII bacterium]|jgi:diadenylate cyclase|nr:diadenylate cyclase CdaA [Clostridiales Family XIII bacterium]
MSDFFLDFASKINITDFIDVAIIAFVIYNVLKFIRETRAEQLVKGLLVLVIATFASGLFHLNALNWLLKGVMQFGVIALVIVFQPELRRGLEYVGRSKILKGRIQVGDKDTIKKSVNAIVRAVDYLQANKIGALIIIEREVTLNDFAESGTVLNSDLSPAILENIFYVGAPLHDGAAIVRGSEVYAAGCVLPLTRNKDLEADLGTRHRAGIGITEVSDAFSIIVSEETGIISSAIDGKITRFLDIKSLEKSLYSIYIEGTEAPSTKGIFKAFERTIKPAKEKAAAKKAAAAEDSGEESGSVKEQ